MSYFAGQPALTLFVQLHLNVRSALQSPANHGAASAAGTEADFTATCEALEETPKQHVIYSGSLLC